MFEWNDASEMQVTSECEQLDSTNDAYFTIGFHSEKFHKQSSETIDKL